MADTFLVERITNTKALIVAYENAMLAFDDGIQEYSINTGQTVTRVSRADIGTITDRLNSLYALLQRLQIMNGDAAGTSYSRPGW